MFDLKDCILNCTNKPVAFAKESSNRTKLIIADVNNDKKFRFLSQVVWILVFRAHILTLFSSHYWKLKKVVNFPVKSIRKKSVDSDELFFCLKEILRMMCVLFWWRLCEIWFFTLVGLKCDKLVGMTTSKYGLHISNYNPGILWAWIVGICQIVGLNICFNFTAIVYCRLSSFNSLFLFIMCLVFYLLCGKPSTYFEMVEWAESRSEGNPRNFFVVEKISLAVIMGTCEKRFFLEVRTARK